MLQETQRRAQLEDEVGANEIAYAI